MVMRLKSARQQLATLDGCPSALPASIPSAPLAPPTGRVDAVSGQARLTRVLTGVDAVEDPRWRRNAGQPLPDARLRQGGAAEAAKEGAGRSCRLLDEGKLVQ